MKRPNYLILLLCLLVVESIMAGIRLPAIISSNMVLQRNAEITIWGWADAGEQITINTSWLNSPFLMTADKNGDWILYQKTTDSKTHQSITLSDETSTLLLENIVFGEVWLCSGQSNMEQPLNGFNRQPAYGSMWAVFASKNDDVWLFNEQRNGNKMPLKELGNRTSWQQASPEYVARFSAVGYFFGKQLQEILDCPVGIIHTSFGGSTVEARISKEVTDSFQIADLTHTDSEKKPQHISTALFNAMLNPLIPFTLMGVLWYQGEHNFNEPALYKKFFPAMVEDWRSRWNTGDFPFYYVQIAPYSYDSSAGIQSVSNAAFMREAQLQCLDLIPNSGIAITIDIGDKDCIHPPKKKQVADRLLYHALNKTYGFKTIDYLSPVFDTLEIENGGILLKFKNAENGLYAFNELDGFEIAGDDRVFYPAKALIRNRMDVYVTNKSILEPVAVRYGWYSWFKGSLYDTNLLPASSFRMDDWGDAERINE